MVETPEKSWQPTNKWLAATVVGVAGLATLWIQAGSWNSAISVALVALLSQRIVAYLTPNDPASGGVKDRKPRAAAAAKPHTAHKPHDAAKPGAG